RSAEIDEEEHHDGRRAQDERRAVGGQAAQRGARRPAPGGGGLALPPAHGGRGRGPDWRRALRAQPRAGEPLKRLADPALGHPRRHDRARDPQAALGLLLSRLVAHAAPAIVVPFGCRWVPWTRRGGGTRGNRGACPRAPGRSFGWTGIWAHRVRWPSGVAPFGRSTTPCP